VEAPLRPLNRGLWAISPLLCIGICGCSVADNLSGDEIVAECDGIVTVVGSDTERRIEYATKAPVAAWYMRQFWLVPIRWVLGPVFGHRTLSEIESPSTHVRQLLEELPDETGGDVVACARATTRFGWIAEADSNGNSRVVGIDGLVAMAGQLEIPLFAGSFEAIGLPLDATRRDEARRVIQAQRPDARGEGAGEQLADYRQALATLTERPLAEWTQRLLLVEDLVELLGAERDRETRVATEAALRAAIGHCVAGVLLRAVEDRDPGRVEVRLCAMEQIRRLGGPRTVPLLLAVMSATPQQLARFEPRFDPDPLVQLRLIHLCGQLRGELATTEVRLPGRENWQAIAPVDFLAQAILTEQTYYSPLRTPAMAALTLSLDLPRLDPDVAWVRSWYRERRKTS
jgi:hypothetical protein